MLQLKNHFTCPLPDVHGRMEHFITHEISPVPSLELFPAVSGARFHDFLLDFDDMMAGGEIFNRNSTSNSQHFLRRLLLLNLAEVSNC